MKIAAALTIAAITGGMLAAQESKPVPKDSVRVFVPGCSKGRIFTAAARRGPRIMAALPFPREPTCG
jgi:hypothetical protein